MAPRTKPLAAVILVIIAALCFGFGASTRGGGVAARKGSVVDIVAIENVPGYVNRWCLIKDGTRASSKDVAIVGFGEGQSRHLYAYPQTAPSALAAHDLVMSEIETCSIRKIAATGTGDASPNRQSAPSMATR